MFEELTRDRAYLENKYHRTDEPFNPYLRRKYHGYEYDPATGMSDEELTRGLHEACDEWEAQGLARPVIKALAVEYALEHTRIDVNAQDYFVGIYSWNRPIFDATVRKWHDGLFATELSAEWEQMERFNRAAAVNMWVDYDHIVPDWDALMSLGFSGILERARGYRRRREASEGLDARQRAYFDGIEIEYRAILRLIDRLHGYALTQTHEKAPKIAQCLEHLREGAPTNTYEALQLMYLYFMVSENVDAYQVRSLGNGLDHTLRPFWEADLARGVPRERLCEILGYFMMQFSAIGNYWGHPFYLGGTAADGSTLVDHVSYDILNTYRALDIYNPKIQIKVNVNTPTAFLHIAYDMVRTSRGSFVFCCEPGMTRAVMSYGATAEEARTIDIRGCYETGVRANEIVTADAYVNALKAVLYAMRDGYDGQSRETVGVRTGSVDAFATFEDFYAAVLQQLEYLTETAMSTVSSIETHLEEINPSSVYSATVTHSLERARDAYAGGVKFNNSAILICGFGSFVDALMAVKKVVYEEKRVSLSELAQALEHNWEGYEELRQRILRLPHKYGNGDPETQTLATALSHWFALRVDNRPTARGGVYKALMHSAMQFIWQGEKTGASPDGRRAGEEISKNASPAPGADRAGVTALIRSALDLTPYLYTESFCLDVMLHPSAVSGERGLATMDALVRTYMAGGGIAIQFNVFDTSTLRDAQLHPERYQGLQVRVAGWNVLWNNLSRAEQDGYIRRAEANRKN
ncbi:MAG: hypothetical protein IJW30_03475 [Clostridia bacterium]|nr:hypothetical protein [Clostridia bacterium]